MIMKTFAVVSAAICIAGACATSAEAASVRTLQAHQNIKRTNARNFANNLSSRVKNGQPVLLGSRFSGGNGSKINSIAGRSSDRLPKLGVSQQNQARFRSRIAG
jgi:hypothetical protein